MSPFLRSLPLLIALAARPGFAVPDPPASSNRCVVVLYSENQLQPATLAQDAGLRAALAAPGAPPVDVDNEFLDCVRLEDEGLRSNAVRFLQRKYEQRRVDLLVAMSGPSYRFLARHRDDIFPGVPIVFCGVDQRELAANGRLPRSTGITTFYDIAGTVRAARALQPGLRRLVFILGHSDRSRYWAGQANLILKDIDAPLAASFWMGRPLADMRRELRQFGRDTAVIFGEYLSDSNGNSHVSAEVCEQVCAASAAPVYGLYDTLLGRGIVGGQLASFREPAREAGALAQQVLAGATPDSLPVKAAAAARLVIDWTPLQRWGLDPSALPPDARIVNRPPSLWQRSRKVILASGTLILLQAVLIGVLLWESRKRQRAEQARRRTEDWLTLAAESMGLGVWGYEAGQDRLFGTDQCFRMIGLPSTESITMEQMMRATHPEDRGIIRQAVQGLADGEGSFFIEYRVIHPDGQVHWISERARRCQLPGESEPILLGVSVDITERKEAEGRARRQRDELARLTRRSALGEMAAVLAHELNQPLGAILSNADAALLLLQRQSGGPELADILADIRTQDQRAGEIIQRIRSLFQRGEGQFAPVQLNDLVLEAADHLRTDLLEKSVALTLALEPDLPRLEVDRVQMQQVLVNLILNAAEALGTSERPPRERTIILRTRRRGDTHLEVAVEDNGPGVPVEEMDRIFHPFYSTKERGMGLGLSICRSILEGHRGRITVSTQRGEGAIFQFTLPLHPGKGTHT